MKGSAMSQVSGARMWRMKTAFQNGLFWSLFVLVSALYIPAAIMVVAFFSVLLRRRTTLWMTRRAISYYGWLILRCAWPFIQVRYEDLSGGESDIPFIFVCNHRSASDPFLMACLPFECVQIVKRWPLRLPVLGFMARVAGYLSIHEMPLDRFYARGMELYENGVSIISFPEGTRSGTREMGPFTSSIFRLARRCKAPIVPLAIMGNEDKPERGSILLRPGTVRVHKLPAIRYNEYRDMSIFTLKNHVRDVLGRHMESVEGRDD